MAHTRPRASFAAAFLPLSVSSYASTALPFVLAAHDAPARLPDLDDTLDAAIVCTVGRRASVAQGRALLSIWERCLAESMPSAEGEGDSHPLVAFSRLVKASSSGKTGAETATVSAHLAPLFGAVGFLAGLSRQQTAYVFMLSHIKALVSAAVRASIFGPYQAQKILASAGVQALVDEAIRREWRTPVDEAGQSVPVMDLWIGRHEMLYSRIFNS